MWLSRKDLIFDSRKDCSRISVVLSLVITASVFLICYRHSYMLYMTNDDAGIQNLLNGFTTGINDPAHQFINIILGYPLTLLYKVIPTIQWWYIYSQFLMLIGTFLVNYAMIRVGGSNLFSMHRNTHKILIAFKGILLSGTVLLFNISFSVPAISSTSFTVVPALYGGGIAALLFLQGYKGSVDNRFLWLILVLFLPVVLHRKSSSYAIMPYLFLVGLWTITLKNDFRQATRKFALWAILALLLFEVFITADSRYKNWLNGVEFTKFNKARAELLDHSRDTYEDNPDLYETVGWDRDTYVMVSKWCFVDDRCTAETMHYIAGNGNAKDSSPIVITNGMFSDSRMRNLIFTFLGLFVIAILSLGLHRSIRGLLFLVMDFAGTFILIAYQIFTGRVVYRSLVVVLLPASVLMILLLLSAESIKGGLSDEDSNNRMVKYALGGLIALSLILSLNRSLVLAQNFIDLNEIRTNAYVDNDDAIHQYLMNHKENFYVMQIGMKANINPRLIYEDDISNSFYWGGSDYHSHTRRYVLQKNGLDCLDDKAFLADNVYLISAETYLPDISSDERNELEKNSEVYAFCHWMSTLHPEYVMEKTDEIFEGMNVYKFVLKE